MKTTGFSCLSEMGTILENNLKIILLFYFGRMTVVLLLTPISSTCNLELRNVSSRQRRHFKIALPGNHRVFIKKKKSISLFFIFEIQTVSLFGTFEGGYFFRSCTLEPRLKKQLLLQTLAQPDQVNRIPLERCF